MGYFGGYVRAIRRHLRLRKLGLITSTSCVIDSWAPTSIFTNSTSILLSNGLLCHRSPLFSRPSCFLQELFKISFPEFLFQAWSLGISNGCVLALICSIEQTHPQLHSVQLEREHTLKCFNIKLVISRIAHLPEMEN